MTGPDALIEYHTEPLRREIDRLDAELVAARAEIGRLMKDPYRAALAWTRERPTEPGWYWLDCEPDNMAHVVEVTIRSGKLVAVWGEVEERCVDAFPPGYKWAGPIPEPSESREPAKEDR